MHDEPKYWAFISYSHVDEKWAKWLHRALETYAVPRHLVGRDGPGGAIPKRLQPIFRDRDEFAASTDLSSGVRRALERSRNLIILCSPDAAKSKWVNQEILEFRKAGGKDNILCAIVGPEPGAVHAHGELADTCFPPALSQAGHHAEPLAADLRKGFDGKRLGKLKIIAGLLGLGLDELVQRDSQRRHHRLLAMTGASVAGMGLMAFLAVSAIYSQRNEALQKARAEEMVEFMLGDLRNQLQPGGSLDTLASLSKQALDYYASLEPGDLDTADNIRRARALLAIGEIENLRGDIEKATVIFSDASSITAALLAANPDEPERIFDHAQSVYWLGYIDYQLARLDAAAEKFSTYLRLADRLVSLEPANRKWQAELASAHANLGVIQLAQGSIDAALDSFITSRDILEAITESRPDDIEHLTLLANTHAWIGEVQEQKGDVERAFDSRVAQIAILQNLHQRDPGNTWLSVDLVGGWRHLGRISLARGNLDVAEKQFLRSIERGRVLLTLDATNAYWREITGRSFLAYGELLLDTDRLNEADRAIAEAERIAESLIEQEEDVLDWQVVLAARADLLRARWQHGRAQSGVALAALEGLISRLTEFSEQHPDNLDTVSLLASSHRFSGAFLSESGQSEMASIHWRHVVNLLASQSQPLPLQDQALLALGYLRLGQIDTASTIVVRLRQLGYRHPVMDEFKHKVEAYTGDNSVPPDKGGRR